MDLTLAAPLRINLDGSPYWRFEDGTLLPVVSGGAVEDGGGEGGGEGDGGDAGGSDDGGQDGDDDKGKGGKVEFTAEQQAHIDKLLNEQFGKGAAKGAKEKEAAIADYLTAQGLSETDRLKAEKEAAEKRATEATEKANTRLVAADAKIAAGDAKVPKDRLDAFMKLADLSEVTVDDDGKVDTKALEAAVKATLTAHPFLVANASGAEGSSGADMNGKGGRKPPTKLEDAVKASLAS